VKYVIAHDLGTSGNKATLISEQGQLVKSVNIPYETRYFNNNRAEQDPEQWYQSVCIATKELLEGFNNRDVAAVSFSGQMMGCVLVDSKGQILRPGIIWADGRSTEQEEQLRSAIDETKFYRITGHRISSTYSLEKLMWVRDNEPEIFKCVYKMLQPKDYVVYRLTGTFGTDYSDASGTNCFDINTLSWSRDILDSVDISISLLPDVFPSTAVAGKISDDRTGLAKGTKVIIGAGDGVCAAVGAGSIEEGAAYNYLGSSSWISYSSEKPFFDSEMRTFNWVHMVPGLYAPTGTMCAAGNSYQFLRNTLCKDLIKTGLEESISPYQMMDREVMDSVVGAKGLIYLPYLLGERSPRWNQNAKGCFLGMSMEHKRCDMLRAGLEGIFMNLSIILDIFRTDKSFSTLSLSGGLSVNSEIRQLISDIFGISVTEIIDSESATSVGAGICAAVGAGIFPDFTIARDIVKTGEKHRFNKEVHNQYKPVKIHFEKAYEVLNQFFSEIH
jgi:xylulokinase